MTFDFSVSFNSRKVVESDDYRDPLKSAQEFLKIKSAQSADILKKANDKLKDVNKRIYFSFVSKIRDLADMDRDSDEENISVINTSFYDFFYNYTGGFEKSSRVCLICFYESSDYIPVVISSDLLESISDMKSFIDDIILCFRKAIIECHDKYTYQSYKSKLGIDDIQMEIKDLSSTVDNFNLLRRDTKGEMIKFWVKREYKIMKEGKVVKEGVVDGYIKMLMPDGIFSGEKAKCKEWKS